MFNLIELVLGLFGVGKMSKANKAAETIGQINKLVDDNFTSDEEKKKHAALMEKLAINSNNKFVQGGRSALMWSLVLSLCINASFATSWLLRFMSSCHHWILTQAHC